MLSVLQQLDIVFGVYWQIQRIISIVIHCLIGIVVVDIVTLVVSPSETCTKAEILKFIELYPCREDRCCLKFQHKTPIIPIRPKTLYTQTLGFKRQVRECSIESLGEIFALLTLQGQITQVLARLLSVHNRF